MLGQSVMDQYAKTEERLLNGYYSIGEIVEPASQDAFWQEYGLPSIALGQVNNKPKSTNTLLKIAALGAIGYAAYRYFR